MLLTFVSLSVHLYATVMRSMNKICDIVAIIPFAE